MYKRTDAKRRYSNIHCVAEYVEETIACFSVGPRSLTPVDLVTSPTSAGLNDPPTLPQRLLYFESPVDGVSHRFMLTDMKDVPRVFMPGLISFSYLLSNIFGDQLTFFGAHIPSNMQDKKQYRLCSSDILDTSVCIRDFSLIF